MCGISVIANLQSGPSGPLAQASKRIQAMNAALHHRGPDGAGSFSSPDGRVVLGSTRLAIVDVQGGTMPIRVTHGGHTYAIVFNGEIFNHCELRDALPPGKYSFGTSSDTEVLLCAYLEWGSACVMRFNGQFAFAIYDERDGGSVFFARDHVGIKPLFYALLGDGTLLLSSEPKGILSVPEFERAIDKQSVAAYFLTSLTLTNGIEPLDRSWFEGMQSLEPGTHAVYDATGAVKTNRYTELPFGQRAENAAAEPAALARALRVSLERAIVDQLPTEVLCGAALSGGLDSSIVTSIAAAHQFTSEQPLTACAIRFDSAQMDTNEDYRHAALLAERPDVELLAPVLQSEEMMEHLDNLTRAMDRPHDTVRQLGLYLTFRSLRRAGCKVVLVGEGADEFNLGYYRNSPGFAKDLAHIRTPEHFRQVLHDRAAAAVRYFAPGFLAASDFEAAIEHDVETYYLSCPSSDPLERMQYYYAKKFLKYRLDANDRCAMAHSVEARVPFCEAEVVRASLAVPPCANGVLADGGTEKAVLRAAFEDVLPPQIARRAKYALPESRDVRLYRMVLTQLDAAIAAAEPGVWQVLDREHLLQLRTQGEVEVGAVEREEVVRHTLTDEQALTEPVGFRIKHLFLQLTFLRWHALYFGGGLGLGVAGPGANAATSPALPDTGHSAGTHFKCGVQQQHSAD
jgi:asparagine synthase (glutamine-hydrolysing)